MAGPGAVRRDNLDLADFARLAGTLPESYYQGLARGYCGGCGAALPAGASGHCDAACEARERKRNSALFGREPLLTERRRGLETEGLCSDMPPVSGKRL